MEITYTRQGDYLIPVIQLSTIQTRPLGKYGRMRRAFLQENRPITYTNLSLTEQLFPHLWEVQETASRRVDQLMSELMKQNPPPDRKANQMGWVQHMNSLKAQAEELVISDLITS